MGVSERRSELSWQNLTFCAMVLFIHCSSQPLAVLRADSWQFALVFLLQKLSFVSVYGFFLLSGVKLTLARGRRVSAVQYYKGRLKSILLPYFIAMLVYYVWFSAVLGYIQPSVSGFLGYLVRGDLSSPFYFIIALTQLIVLMPLLRYTAEHVSPALSLPLALAVSWMSELYFEQFLQLFIHSISFAYGDRVFTTYLFYYLAGCYIGLHYDAFLTALQQNRRFITGAFVLFAAFDAALSYRGRVLSLWSPLWPMAHLAYLLAAITFCFLAASSIRRPLPRWLAQVDRASFLIYLYHALAISALDKILERTDITGAFAPYLIRIVTAFTLVPLGCVIWQRTWGAIRRNGFEKNRSGESV